MPQGNDCSFFAHIRILAFIVLGIYGRAVYPYIFRKNFCSYYNKKRKVCTLLIRPGIQIKTLEPLVSAYGSNVFICIPGEEPFGKKMN
ncbi:hypothetical protein BLA28_02920 [Eisenbergiella tayi]|nr:hypothetical protein BLA28_02920 [Eisenbergiella tayi]